MTYCLELETEYINRSETLIITIMKNTNLWSFKVRRFKSGEVLMDGTEDLYWRKTKKEIKKRLENIFGELEPMSQYKYRKRALNG